MRIYAIAVSILLFFSVCVICYLLYRVTIIRDAFDGEFRKRRDAEDRIRDQTLTIGRLSDMYQDAENRCDSLYRRFFNGIESNGDSIRRKFNLRISDEDLAKIALVVSDSSTCKVNADGALCKDGDCWHGWVKWMQQEKKGGDG